MTTKAVGLLAGWKRRETEHCVVLTLQLIESELAPGKPELGRVMLAVSDGQLCSLARDLTRAAEKRGLEVQPKGPFHNALSGADRLLGRLMKSAAPRHRPKRLETRLLPDFSATSALASPTA